uniref:FHA domain-containing protein n=1 Tax=Anolis carolinensis TaxID=28377 RepID=A0A803TS10_ANOCA|nr:PREDICTED: antigen KI-67 isoform X1 [Anolis carolinensis]|eukprot:XP_008104893.1 PREDICTED: antigen KI-67 isoform X1 [Anolis carolinensis]
MPLYGKIVVIKRNGADGTHFPLTASSCLFGRKKECDIRIQLPEVSKEHCKIEINENKEVILFNLSSTNPTQLNGNNVQDHTFLKHGDILTVIDRSFRFEYPPLSPRQKRSCRSQEKEMLQVLHVQQKEQDLLHPQDSENRNPKISDIKKSPQKCKNTKHLLTQRLGKRKRASFGVQLCPELLDERLPPNSPHKRNKIARRLSLPLQNSPRAVLKNDPGLRHSETKDQDQPNLMERAALPQGHGSPAALSVACRMSTKKTRSSFLRHMLTEECLIISTDSSSTDRIAHVQTLDASGNRDWPQEEEDKIKQPTTNNPIQDVETENNEPMSSNAFERGLENGVEVPAEAVLESNVSSPLTRKSGIKTSPQMPENTEHVLLTEPLGKRKRVSFGGQLSPELFDKRLPPNSPLKRGATPRRMTLPFGNSPRAVLKKGLGLRQSVTEVQHKTVLMKNASPKACRSPTTSPKTHAASSPTQKSPATSPKAPTTAFSTRRSPAATPIAHSSPSTSPAARKPPTPLPQRKGRFSISHVTCPSSEERDSITTQIHQNKEFDCVKTSESVGVVSQADSSVRRSKKFALKRSSMRRSSRMDSVHSKRRSGASEANLIVAKSWAEVVKQGVPKSQAKMTRTKCGVKKSPKKKPTKLSKNNVSTRRTPIRKAKGQFTSTGHANSPAPILIGKAHSSIMNLAAQVPKVMFNYPLKQHDLNESFTGMIEMFKTPLKGDEKRSLSSAQKTTSEVISEVHSPGKSGEASTKAFNVTNQHRLCNQDIVSPFSEKSQDACLGQDDLQIAPREANTRLEVTVRKNSLPVSVKETPALENKNPEIKSETMEEVSDVKKIIGTPKQKAETVEALSGVKRILRTPKEKPEPVEALSGVKRILRTPKDKPEPVEALSGVKRILRTPEQKTEPVEALSGIKRILRTPKEKSEPVEALSGIKRLLKTPEQKTEPVEVFSGVKRTSMQDLEPTKVFSGIRSLLRTPKENLSLVADDIVCSKLTKTPEVALPGSSEKEHTIQPMENHADEVPKEKVPPLEDLEEIQKQLRTPKQRPEVMQDLVGIGQLFKTPKQRVLPVDDFFGLPKLMAEPKQSSLSPEIDYTGVKDIFSAAHEHKDEILETASVEEDHGPSMNSRNNSGEASMTPFNVTYQQRLCNQDIVSSSEMSQDTCLGQDDLQITSREANSRLDVTVKKNRTPVLENKNPEKKSETMEEVSDVKKITWTPKQKIEPVEVISGVKRIFITPKEKPEPVEAFMGVKRILRTPKDKPEPVEALSGVKRIFRTPKEKPEPVEALSGVKRIFRTPKEKPEPVEALSGVKRILRTPKEKPEPVEALSGVKRILRTPKQKTEPVEALSGIKRILRTPKEKTEPVEALSGIKKLLKTPEQKTEPVEVFSGVKRTPMQDLEPTKVILGIKSLLRTSKENLSLVADDIVCSKLTKTPEVALLGSSKKEHTIQPMENQADEIPKEKVPPLEKEIQKRLRTPKQRPEVMQDLVGIGQLFKTPKQRVLPVDDFFGLPKLMTEPKQSSLSPEIDYTGVKDIFSAADEHKDEILETANVEEDHGPSMNSRNNSDSLENELDERKGPNLEDLTEIKFPFTTESEEHTCDLKPKDNLLNELKTEATEMECIPKICQEDGTKSPKADKIIFLKKPALNLGSTDKEMAEPLVSGRRTRKRTYVESSTALKQKGKIQKLTRNSKTAKSDRYEKNNNSVQQSIPESSKLSIETDCNIQIKEIEPSKMESIGNKICLRYTRRKATPLKTENEILNTAITENKSGNTNYAASELYKTEALENNTEEFKENAIKGKGKKVHFLLEKNNSMSLEDKCVLGDNEGIPEEERSAFSKRSTSAKEKTSRRSKCKSSVVSQQLCFSPSEGKHTFETCRDKDKKGIQLSFESSNLTKEDPIVVSSGFSHGKNVQEIQAEERSNETQKLPLESIQEHPARRQKVARRNPPRNVCNKYKCLEQIQNETSLENISSKTVQTFKDNIPPRRQAEVKECFARKTCTEEVSKETAEKEHNLAGSIGDNRPKRGRAKKIVLREETASAEESHKTDSFISARRECSLKQTQNDANAYGTQGMPMENVEAPTEHSPSERFKIPKEDPPKRGKKKVIDQKTLAECEMKAAAVIKDENTVAKNVHSTKKSETKRGRGRKIASVSLLPPLEDNSLILSPSIKSKTAIEQGSGISETTATVDSGTLSHRGRRRKVDDINATNSAPILLDKDKEKKICKDLPEEKLSKRGRRKQLVLHETSTVNNSELGNSENTGLGKDKPMHLETGFEQKNQSKRKRGKQNVLASNELLPSLKVSITLPSSSEKDRTASENPSTFTESVGKNKRTKSDRKNEIVGCTTSLRRNKSTEEVFQEKDLEKKTLVNEKQCRRGRKKVTFEPEVCASLKEKAGITVSCAASEDQQEVLDNIAFSKKVPSCRRGQTFHKGKILQKDTDQINTSQNDQDNSSELLPQVAKKNPLRMGRRKEVKNVSETSTTILDVSEGFVAERRSTKSKKEKTENTTLKKGRKTKDSTAVTDPSETEGRTRGSRTRKRLL